MLSSPVKIECFKMTAVGQRLAYDLNKPAGDPYQHQAAEFVNGIRWFEERLPPTSHKICYQRITGAGQGPTKRATPTVLSRAKTGAGLALTGRSMNICGGSQ